MLFRRVEADLRRYPENTHQVQTGMYDESVPVEVSGLVESTQEIMSERKALEARLGESEKDNVDAIIDILRVGTSASGARSRGSQALSLDVINVIR